MIKITTTDSRGNSALLQLTTVIKSQSALNGVVAIILPHLVIRLLVFSSGSG